MTLTRDLWSLARQPGQIDPQELARAVEEQAGDGVLDFRTRLLVRDSIEALRNCWGPSRVDSFLSASPHGNVIAAIERSLDDEPAGFGSLRSRVMEPTRRETVMRFLRDLSERIDQPTTLVIGGSIALILEGRLTRHTDDIDIVDEVPRHVREQAQLLSMLAQQHGLSLTHFQSHFLPPGWQARARSLARMGSLDVRVVDSYDVITGKLLSARDKDRGDLVALAPTLDRTVLTTRLREWAEVLNRDAALAQNAGRNWYVLFGEQLPSLT